MGIIAKMLDLVALDELRLAYRFDERGGGRLRLAGTLHAKVTQTCVISLDPVEARIEVPVEVEFWPADLISQPEGSASEPATSGLGDWPEGIMDGRIDLGPVLYESLATALDPYPKREGASFAWSEGEEAKGEGAGSGPFAALAALKRR
jgi:uncharacterized metal-binding protein YceD (DUF177 family)